METNNLFSGVATALVTPFLNDRPNLFCIEKIIDAQLNAGIDCIVLFGTTGEPYSLSESEKKLIFYAVKEMLCGKAKIVCGASYPCTKQAIRQVKMFESWGADGLLVSTPYFYKCAVNGVIGHFLEVCQSTSLPVAIYNVPSRTSCDIFADKRMIAALEGLENIAFIKQAGQSLEQNTAAQNSTSIPVYCGNDAHFYQMLESGCSGTVSVISNVYPKTIKAIYSSFKKGDIEAAQRADNKLKKLYTLFECEPNPIPVKYACSLVYGGENSLRLPLTPLAVEHSQPIKNFILNNGD